MKSSICCGVLYRHDLMETGEDVIQDAANIRDP
jgi:hypothetical protein